MPTRPRDRMWIHHAPRGCSYHGSTHQERRGRWSAPSSSPALVCVTPPAYACSNRGRYTILPLIGPPDMIVRADVVLPYTTGLPRDVAMNTWHFDCDESPSLEASTTAMVNGLINFYTGDVIVAGLSAWLSETIDRGSDRCRVNVYEVGTVGPPLASVPFTVDDPIGTAGSLPLEVAVCLSYVAGGSGLPAGRKRGRVFIGPLTVGSLDNDDQQIPFPDNTLREYLTDGAEDLMALEADGAHWIVYSRASAASAGSVTRGWVDNEFDTQRRRQRESTSRILFGT
jgi:hypothetical protein